MDIQSENTNSSLTFDQKNKEKTNFGLQTLTEKAKEAKNEETHEELTLSFNNNYPLDEKLLSQISSKFVQNNLIHLKFENYYNFDGNFFSLLQFFPKLRSLFLNNIRIKNFPKFLDFFSEENIKNLEFLTFSNTNINDTFLKALCQKPFKNLSILNLNSSFALKSEAFLDFFDSPMALNLKSLSLQNMEITDSAIFSLCFSKNCCKIQELDLSLCSALDDVAYINILMSPNLKNLKKLHLFNTMATTLFLSEFDQKSEFSGLQTLRLEENYGIKSEGYGFIGNSSKFENLEHLQISMSSINDENFKKIYDSKFLKNLKTLIFYDNPKISRICLKEFALSELSKNIEVLDLSWMDLDDVVLVCLGKSNNLEKLKFLKIVNCKYVGPEGFLQFLETKNAGNLEKMHFMLTKIDDRALELLMRKSEENLIKLREIDIRKCGNITKEKINKLIELGKRGNFMVLND